MSGLSLKLLGPFDASLNNRPLVKFETKRTQALLAFLATESALRTSIHQRKALMELLWPGLPLKSARISLRQTLYLLRKVLGELRSPDGDESLPFMRAGRLTVQVNPDYPLELDVAEFAWLLAGPRNGWAKATAVYRGDFLSDFYLADANAFEE